MTERDARVILGAALGNCVHVAGVAGFLRQAEQAGFETVLLGAAAPVERVLRAVRERRPHALAVSYRLAPSAGRALLERLLDGLSDGPEVTLLFGGTPEMVRIAEATGRFAACFSGQDPPEKVREVLRALRGERPARPAERRPAGRPPVGQEVDRLPLGGDGRTPVPLLRHHFGLGDLEATVAGVERISEAGVLDVLSIAPDQNAQECFFRPRQMDRALDGAGGVPLRRADDLRRLHRASRRGNFPHLRIYSGTRDLLRWAELSVRALHNAWGTIPLTWYCRLDGRSDRPVEAAVAENLSAVRWYAGRGLPVEINEAHQWSLRGAPDAVAIAMAYVAARAAAGCGVRQYFGQYMFHTPPFTTAVCDLAKMAAKLALIETLRGEGFTPYRQVRAGLRRFAADPDVAKGQLAAATPLMLALRPHLLHVVGHAEGDHACSAEEVIESCRIARGAVGEAVGDRPDPLADPRVGEVQRELLAEARLLLGTLQRFGAALGAADPLGDPKALAQAVRCGLLDAPDLRGQPGALGAVRTGCVAGRCRPLDARGRAQTEADRLRSVLREGPAASLLGPGAEGLIAPPDPPIGSPQTDAIGRWRAE